MGAQPASEPRIWRALLWKEWREQRAIIPAGLAIAVLIPVIIYVVGLSTASRLWNVEVAEVVPFLMAVTVWPMFAAVAGAATGAEGRGGDSLAFLLSRPVSRSSVWVCKVAVGWVGLGAIVGGSFLFAELFHYVLVGQWFRFPFPSDPFNGFATDAVQAIVVGAVLLCFAATLACGTLVRQQVTAAAAGVLIAATFAACALTVQGRLAAGPGAAAVEGAALLISVFLGISVAGVLATSHYLYRRGVMLHGASWRRPLLVGSVTTILVAGVGLVAAAGAATRIDPDTARFRVRGVIPDKNAVLLSVSGTRFAGTRFWIHPLDESPRRLTDRMAERADVVPGGELIVYSTRMGALGFRRDDCELRAVGSDGTDDRVLHEHVACGGTSVFSADGSRVAVRSRAALPNRDRLYVASIDGPPVAQPIVDYHGTAAEGAVPVVWVRDTSTIVLDGRRQLFLLDVDTGAIRELFAPADAASVYVEASSGSHLLVRSYKRTYDEDDELRRSYRLDLLDLVSGSEESMAAACADTAEGIFSPDGARLLYTGCPNVPESAGELRVRDLRTGADRRVARYQGALWMHQVSPGGTRLAATERRPRHRRTPRSRTVFFDVDGDGEAFARVGTFGALARDGWRFSDWLDDERVFVWKYRRGERRSPAGIVDLDSGALRIIGGR